LKSDITRSTFDPTKRYTGVRMQQGRVQVDADWNEQIEMKHSFQKTKPLHFVLSGAMIIPHGWAIIIPHTFSVWSVG